MINPVVYSVTLDVYKVGSQRVLSMMRGDTGRKLAITLTENDRPYHLDEGSRAMFTALKPDGNFIYNNCDVDETNSTILYNVTEQTLAASGKMSCQLRVVSKEGSVITTPSFTVVVDDILYNEEEIVNSSTEFNALTAYIADLQAKVDRGDFNGKSIYIRGSVNDKADLDAYITTSEAGDGYIAGDDHLYVFDGEKFVDVGLVRGPRGVSGVYVGSGEMPPEYNVQIDPNGEVLVMDKELNYESKNPVENRAIAEQFAEMRATIESMRGAIDMISNSLEQMGSRISSLTASDISTDQQGENVENSLGGLWATKLDSYALIADNIPYSYGNTNITNVADALTLALGKAGI